MKKVFLFLVFVLFGTGLSGIVAQEDTDFNALLQEGSVTGVFSNDETYPWTIGSDGVATSGNGGEASTTSSLKFSYESDYPTEMVLTWKNYYYREHSFIILVDNNQIFSSNNSSWQENRFYISKGAHVVEFRSSMASNNADPKDNSQIKQLRITEIKELESEVLSPESKPLTFNNDTKYPWVTRDGYIASTNYGTPNSSTRFSTSFNIDKPSKFSFDKAFTGDDYRPEDDQKLRFYINGELYDSGYGWNGSYSNVSVLLEPGQYELVWVDSIGNTSDKCEAYIKNIELSDNWLDIEVTTPGTLGIEVLYQVNVLNDVELLKVRGTINETDWTSIKNMKNIIGLDLSEAKCNQMPDYAFDGLKRLSYVTLPEGISSIGEYAFRGTQLLNIDIPNSVTNIKQYAFAETRVRTINFTQQSLLKTIGYSAFYKCNALKEFIMPNGVNSLETESNRPDYSTRTFQECNNITRIHFADSLRTIGNQTCYNCPRLSEVKLPKSLDLIKNSAFSHSTNLHHLDFPETLRTIETYAFEEAALDSVILPVKLSSLGNSSFRNCKSLKYVELPSYIPSYNTNFDGCTAIQKIVCKSATPPVITQDPFKNGSNKTNVTLVVPSFSVANYKLDTYWLQFGDIQEMDIDLEYWRLAGDLMLTNNRRIDNTPDLDLYYGARLTVGGSAPMPVRNMNVFINESKPALLLNNCEQFTVDSLTTCYSVNDNTWYFLTPMHDVQLSDVKHSANASFVFRYYNGANRAASGMGSSWQNVDTDTLYAGQGYIFQCNASGQIYLPATQESQSKIFTFTEITKALETYESENVSDKNWNYVGNPYPCYYDIYYMDFTAPITVWDSSNRNYRAYSITDDDFVLHPMQAFFVQKPDAVNNIVFRPEGRQLDATVNRAKYAPAPQTKSLNARHIYNVELKGEKYSDQTRVVLNENKSLGYEIECDASKFMSMENDVPQIFTLDNDGNRLAINERPADNGIVRLGITVGNAGTYTIDAVRADGDISLYDAETGITTDLAEKNYTFKTEATETIDRFSLILKARETTGTEITEKQTEVTVTSTNGGIIVKGITNASVKVYSLSGTLLYNINQATGNSFIPMAQGTYLVRVNGNTYKTIVL